MGEGHNAASEPWSYAYLRLKKGGGGSINIFIQCLIQPP